MGACLTLPVYRAKAQLERTCKTSQYASEILRDVRNYYRKLFGSECFTPSSLFFDTFTALVAVYWIQEIEKERVIVRDTCISQDFSSRLVTFFLHDGFTVAKKLEGFDIDSHRDITVTGVVNGEMVTLTMDPLQMNNPVAEIVPLADRREGKERNPIRFVR